MTNTSILIPVSFHYLGEKKYEVDLNAYLHRVINQDTVHVNGTDSDILGFGDVASGMDGGVAGGGGEENFGGGPCPGSSGATIDEMAVSRSVEFVFSLILSSGKQDTS